MAPNGTLLDISFCMGKQHKIAQKPLLNYRTAIVRTDFAHFFICKVWTFGLTPHIFIEIIIVKVKYYNQLCYSKYF